MQLIFVIGYLIISPRVIDLSVSPMFGSKLATINHHTFWFQFVQEFYFFTSFTFLQPMTLELSFGEARSVAGFIRRDSNRTLILIFCHLLSGIGK